MMLFSLTFTLDKEKREIINKTIRKKKIKLAPKKCLAIFLICMATCFFIWSDTLQLGASLFLIIALPYILINIFTLFEHKNAEDKLYKRTTTFSLYEDRIEITDNPTADYKGTFERVYPLSAVTEISDFPEFIIILLDNSDKQFVMKKDLTEEQLKILNSKIKKLK